MQMAIVAAVDVSADHQLGAEVFSVDAIYVTVAEDAVTHALALVIAGLDAVDLLRSRALRRARLLVLRPIVLLRRSLPLLLALPTLRSLLLFALLVFNSLLLLALAPLSLLFLLALPALGPLDVVVLTLTLDLLRALALRTLDGAPLGSPFGSRLATFDTGCGSLRCRRTRSLTGCTTLATTVMLAFLTAVLRLSKTRARSSAEQQYACRSGNQSSVHLEHSCWADGCAPCTARRIPEPNACNRPVFRCETE